MTTKKFTARFTKETYKNLEMLAKESQRSKVGVLRFLIKKASEEIKKNGGDKHDGK